MNRLTDTIMTKGQGYANNAVAQMMNLANGGHMAWTPEYTEIINSTAYIRKNMVAIVISAPTGFDFLENPEFWRASLRALFELHPKTIEGLAKGIEWEFAETPVGAAGEMQEHVTDAKRARSQLQVTWDEKDGMPISNFLEGWGTELMMDPNTKTANVMTRANRPKDLLPDVQGATILFYEPNAQHDAPIKAWLGTAIMPRNNGENIGRRDLLSAAELTTHNIPFTGVYQVGNGVLALALKIMQAINLTGANPNNRPAFVDAIDQNILATKKSYENNVETLGAQAVRL